MNSVYHICSFLFKKLNIIETNYQSDDNYLTGQNFKTTGKFARSTLKRRASSLSHSSDDSNFPQPKAKKLKGTLTKHQSITIGSGIYRPPKHMWPVDVVSINNLICMKYRANLNSTRYFLTLISTNCLNSGLKYYLG